MHSLQTLQIFGLESVRSSFDTTINVLLVVLLRSVMSSDHSESVFNDTRC
jgi:hypothetical protein